MSYNVQDQQDRPRSPSVGSGSPTSSPSKPSTSAAKTDIVVKVRDFATKYFNEIVFATMSLISLATCPISFVVGGTLGLVTGTFVDREKIGKFFSFTAQKINDYMPKKLVETAQKMNAAVKNFVEDALKKQYESYVSGNEALVQGMNAVGALYGAVPFGFLAGFQAGNVIARQFLADKVQGLLNKSSSSYSASKIND